MAHLHANAADLVGVWRGELLECVHRGHAVVCDETGAIVQSWGDPQALIYPRSSAKMLQALPLIESGAADAVGLTDAHLALACASHQAAQVHVKKVNEWLSDLGLGDDALLCGPQEPSDVAMRDGLIRESTQPCRAHSNCSGKHAGFLTVTKHLGAGADYVALDHPVQVACRGAIEEMTGEASPTYGIDGCSAPNFATTVQGLARAMARFASAQSRQDARSRAAARLTRAMAAYPELVAGETRACTDLMRAMDGKVAIKTGAEGVYVAIVPEKRVGVALKIVDGATRASECAIATILVGLGVLNPDHPATQARMSPVLTNWDGLTVGRIRPMMAMN